MQKKNPYNLKYRNVSIFFATINNERGGACARTFDSQLEGTSVLLHSIAEERNPEIKDESGDDNLLK